MSRDLSGVRMLAMHTPRAAQAGLWTALTSGKSTTRVLRPGVEHVCLPFGSLDTAVYEPSSNGVKQASTGALAGGNAFTITYMHE